MNGVEYEDTEWNDALRNAGILPPKVEKKDDEDDRVVMTLNEIENAEAELRKKAEDVSDDDAELEELFDGFQESRRVELLSEISRMKVNKKDTIKEITREEYIKEVAETSRVKPVLVLLTDENEDSKKVESALSRIVEEYAGRIDACKIDAQNCITGYPKRNVPTLILYADGGSKKNYVGMQQIHPSKKMTCYEAILGELKMFIPL